MKSENLIKAGDSFNFFLGDLRAAHTDAVNANNQFAEIAIMSLIEQAAKLSLQVARLKDAAILQ